MASQVPDVVLSNGQKMPILGLGTWRSDEGVLKKAIKFAVEIGYRHIDCAHIYLNENQVGEAIKELINEGKVKREELFIVSKSWMTYRTRERVVTGFKKSLELLGLDYLDLYLIHSPIATVQKDDEMLPKDSNGKVLVDDDIDYLETWYGMEDLVEKGLCKSIGISNFSVEQSKRVVDNCKIRPVINQVECHPYFNQSDFIKEMSNLGITVTAYGPLATPDRGDTLSKEFPQLLDNGTMVDIGKKYNKSAAQVAIRYQIERGVIVIPKSVKNERIKQNFDVLDFKLSETDMNEIDELDINTRLFQFKNFSGAKYFPF